MVCGQQYTKTTEWISAKPGWRTGHSPQQSPLTFGEDLAPFPLERHKIKHKEPFPVSKGDVLLLLRYFAG